MISASEIIGWWRSEMATLVPDWVKIAFFGERSSSALVLSESVAQPEYKGRQITVPINLLHAEAPVFPKAKAPQTVDIHFPNSHILRRKIKVPPKARKNIQALAELDLRRNTPMQDGEAVWALGPAKTSGAHIMATQYVAKSSDLARLRRRLTELGLTARRVYVKGEDGNILLQDATVQIKQAGMFWRRLNAGLAAATVLLALFVWLRPAWEAHRSLQTLDPQVAELREQAVAARRALDALQTQQADAHRLRSTLIQRPRLVETIREATNAFPDEAWLSAMTFSPDAVTFTGETSAAAVDIVLSLSSARHFGNPRLSGPTTLTPSGRERFEIAAGLGKAR